MEAVLHRASQYIAAAGISYLVHEADDGHSTMTWNALNGSMTSAPFPMANDISFSLCLPDYAMECHAADGGLLDTFPLQAAEHRDLVSWFKRMMAAQGVDGSAYRYDFHYKLPAHTDHRPFPAPDAKELLGLAELRSIAHEALKLTLAQYPDTEPVRIWPHHFDSGGLIILKREANGSPLRTVGCGLAIPDGIAPSHYYYVSPWHATGQFDLSEMPELTSGHWSTGDFNGAILEAEGMTRKDATLFLVEASSALSEPITI